MLSQGNWEERVAAARKKREQVQAEKPKKRMTPTFPEFAPQFVEEPPAAPPQKQTKASILPPVLTPPPEGETPAPAPAPVVIPDPTPPVAVVPPPVAAETRRNDRALVVAFVGFFGVGIGIALGAGLVWSLGGFNFGQGDTAALQPTQPADTTPGVLQTSFQMRPNPSALVEGLDMTLPTLRSSTAVTKPISGQAGLLPEPVASAAPRIVTAAPFQPNDAPPLALLTVAPQAPQSTASIQPDIALPAAAASQEADTALQTVVARLDATPAERAAPVIAAPSAPLPQADLATTGLAAKSWNTPESPEAALPLLAPLPEAIPATLSLTAPSGGGTTPTVSVTVPYRAFTEIVLPTPPDSPLRLAQPSADLAQSAAFAKELPMPHSLSATRLDRAFASAAPASAPLALVPPATLSARFQPGAPTVLAMLPPSKSDAAAQANAVQRFAPEIEPGIRSDVTPAALRPIAGPVIASVPVFAMSVASVDAAPTLPDGSDSLSFQWGPFDPLALPAFAAGLPEIDLDVWRGPTPWLGLPEGRLADVSLVLNVPRAVEDDAMEAQAATLGRTGLTLTNTNRVPFKITQPHVRFYNAEDADVANALADKFGVELRDFSKGRNSGPNRVEYWMAGTSSATPATAAPRKARTTRRTPARTTQRRTDPRAALRQRLARQLRSGDHL